MLMPRFRRCCVVDVDGSGWGPCLDACGALEGKDLGHALLLYVMWQIMYFVKVEMVEKGTQRVSRGGATLGEGTACMPHSCWACLHACLTHVCVCCYLFRWHWSAKLDADPELLTSLRWLAQDKKNALHQLVLLLTRRYTATWHRTMREALHWSDMFKFTL